jgi:hypothetical protein
MTVNSGLEAGSIPFPTMDPVAKGVQTYMKFKHL